MMPISGKTTALAAMLGALVCATANAQDRTLRPVTDAMLRESGSRRLADVAAHAESLGL